MTEITEMTEMNKLFSNNMSFQTKRFSDYNKYCDAKSVYDDSLDGASILFYKMDDSNTNCVSFKNDGSINNDSDDSDDYIITVNSIKYINEVNKEILPMIDNVDVILNANEIVYPFNNINITFDTPIMDKITFNAKSKGGWQSHGFTMKELISKVIKYFEFIYQSHLHYDLDNAEWTKEPIKDNDLFHTPVGDYMFDNDIRGLEYKKFDNTWVVLFTHYL